jgi:hypothetical protein
MEFHFLGSTTNGNIWGRDSGSGPGISTLPLSPTDLSSQILEGFFVKILELLAFQGRTNVPTPPRTINLLSESIDVGSKLGCRGHGVLTRKEVSGGGVSYAGKEEGVR